MKKNFLTIIICILIFFGAIYIPYSNINSTKAAEPLVTKVAFLDYAYNLKKVKGELTNYKKLNIISDFKTFDGLNAISITANEDTINSLAQCLLPKAKLINNFEFKALPVKVDNEKETNNQDLWNLEDIGAKDLWSKGFTGKGVKIAVLDTGIDTEHPALKNKLVNWAEFSPTGSMVSDSKPYDSDGHGTHVSGITAGGSLSFPLGVAPDANLAVGLVIPRGGGTFAQILGGLEWVLDPDNNPSTDDAPKVVNMSLGAIGYYKTWTEVFEKLLSHNILPVCAIGNEGDGLSSSPGNSPNAIGVGAYDENSEAAIFSSGNDKITWEEEGLSATYVKPDISAPGVQIYSSVPGGKYEKWSGTSMATPHVTGAVALLMQAFPLASAYDIMHFLKDGATDTGKAGTDSRYGFGKLNLTNSYQLLSESKRVYGNIANYRNGFSLYNSDLNLPIYVDKNGNYSTYLLPSSYKVDLNYKGKLIKTTIINVKNGNLNMDIQAPSEKRIQFEGVIKSENSNEPLKAKIFVGEDQYESLDNGRFSLNLDSIETVTIFASGYESKDIDLIDVKGYLNIRLKKSSILLIEGVSPYIAVTNPPRLARNYYFEALNSINKSYTYIDASKIFLNFSDLKNYGSVIYFCDSGNMSSEEEIEFAKYLDNGGRLLITGRLILTIENYYRQTFLNDYFNVSSKESMSFPSVCGYEKSEDFKDFLFSLSGDNGANNQETCDVITVGDSNIVEPILQYVEYKKDKYAGIKVANGIYKGVLLGFGIEGIGSKTQRVALLNGIMDWFESSKKLDCILPSDSNFRINVIREDNKQFSIFTKGERFSINNLEPYKYRFVFEGYGYQISQYEIDLRNYDVCQLELHPEKSPLYNVNISLKDIDLDSAFANIIYMGKSINLIEFNPKNVLSLSLPLGYFEILIVAKEFTPKVVRTKVDNSTDLNFEVKMEKNPKKVLVVDDSKTGDYITDNYLRTGDTYSKTLSMSRIDYDMWIVSKDGNPTFFNYLPYSTVLYVTGRNSYALYEKADRDEIAKYLNNGGNIAISGNTFHLTMRDTKYLEDYFGVTEKISNIRESTLIGSAGTKFSGLVFDLFDPLVEGTTYITYPTFEALKDGVTPLLKYLNGDEISTMLYNSGKFKSILMPFGIDNVFSSDVRQKIITGLVYTLSGDDKILSNISYKPKN
jgi:subtilisin family serine protease